MHVNFVKYIFLRDGLVKIITHYIGGITRRGRVTFGGLHDFCRGCMISTSKCWAKLKSVSGGVADKSWQWSDLSVMKTFISWHNRIVDTWSWYLISDNWIFETLGWYLYSWYLCLIPEVDIWRPPRLPLLLPAAPQPRLATMSTDLRRCSSVFGRLGRAELWVVRRELSQSKRVFFMCQWLGDRAEGHHIISYCAILVSGLLLLTMARQRVRICLKTEKSTVENLRQLVTCSLSTGFWQPNSSPPPPPSHFNHSILFSNSFCRGNRPSIYLRRGRVNLVWMVGWRWSLVCLIGKLAR